MEFGIQIPRFVWDEPIGSTLATTARVAEEVGAGRVMLMDHWFQMEGMWPADEPMLEGYTGLAFLAGHTSRVRLGLMVTGVTYRHPGLLAKTVTTLDVLSGGRAELGIGAAWYEREHRALGVPFPPVSERFERLEETLRICLQMWSDDDGPFAGEYYQLAETLCVPAPLSRPRPPILIGGGGERKTLRLVAQYADACNLFATTTEDVAHKLDVLRGHCDRLGRDYDAIEKTLIAAAPDAGADARAAFLADMEGYAALGIDTIILGTTTDPPRCLDEVIAPMVDDLRAI